VRKKKGNNEASLFPEYVVLQEENGRDGSVAGN